MRAPAPAAPPPGFKRGMTGGELIVRGSAGPEAGAAHAARPPRHRRPCRWRHDRAGNDRRNRRRVRRSRRRCRASGPSAGSVVALGKVYVAANLSLRLHLPAGATSGCCSPVCAPAYGLPVQPRHLNGLLSPLQRRPRRARQGRDPRMDSAMTVTADERAGGRDRRQHGGAGGRSSGCRPARSPSGARVIDAGVEAEAGIDAGLALAEICMGGLGNVAYTPLQIGERSHGRGQSSGPTTLPSSCMASQYAGWAISVDKFFAMGSGPLAGACPGGEASCSRSWAMRSRRMHGVLVLESRTLPTTTVASLGGGEGAAPAARSSPSWSRRRRALAGGVQISARILETGLHKMETLGFDVTAGGERHGHRAAPAGGQERSPGHRPDQRLYPVRRSGPLHDTRGRRRSWRSWRPRCRPPRRATTAHRSTRSSSATRAISTRSIRCCSVPPRSG